MRRRHFPGYTATIRTFWSPPKNHVNIWPMVDDDKHQRHMEGMKREGHAFRWFLLVLVVGFLVQEFWPGKPRPRYAGPCEVSSGPMKSCDD